MVGKFKLLDKKISRDKKLSRAIKEAVGRALAKAEEKSKVHVIGYELQIIYGARRKK